MGHLIESFVVQRVIAQAGWTEGGLRFHHYRDKDQVGVDLVIVRGRDTWGIEVKASASVSRKDGHGLRRLAEACGDSFRGGCGARWAPSNRPVVPSPSAPVRGREPARRFPRQQNPQRPSAYQGQNAIALATHPL